MNEREQETATLIDNAGREFAKLLNRLKLKRKGLNFYALRHTFQTIAEAIHDAPAIDRIMGHEKTADMATRYRERIDDARLQAVTDHVRRWLFPTPTAKQSKGRKTKVSH